MDGDKQQSLYTRGIEHFTKDYELNIEIGLKVDCWSVLGAGADSWFCSKTGSDKGVGE